MLRPKDLCQGSGTKTFLEAMQSGKVHLARFVLDALDGRIINCKSESGRTLLMHAVCVQDNSTRGKFTHLLLEKGADVNSREEHGRTALSLACELGHLDAVKLLVQFNADPELTDTLGNSALMYAAWGGHNHILEFLVRAFKKLGLQLGHTNPAGHSAIQVADLCRHNQCVQALDGCRKMAVSPTDSKEETAGDLRWPNRLSKQVLERFSRGKMQSKNEELFPALFQIHVGDSSSLQIRFRHPPQSPDGTGLNHRQPFNITSDRNPAEKGQELLFASKQIHNSVIKDAGSTSRMELGSERCQTVKHEHSKTLPLCEHAFKLDIRSNRTQSYQGNVQEINRSATKVKNASHEDGRPLVVKLCCHDNTEMNDANQSHNNETKCRNEAQTCGKQNKILLSQEVEPERLTGLGTRLIRRVTAPEFIRLITDSPSDAGQRKGKMWRSETFPLPHTQHNPEGQPGVVR